jgi:hypothetical protein
MISLILRRTLLRRGSKPVILDYCASDVYGLEAPLPVMASQIDWPRALFRGHYMSASAWGAPRDSLIRGRSVARITGLVTWQPDPVVAGGLRCLCGRLLSNADAVVRGHGVAVFAIGAPRLDKNTLRTFWISPYDTATTRVRSSLGAMLHRSSCRIDGHNRPCYRPSAVSRRAIRRRPKSVFSARRGFAPIKPAEGESSPT